MTYRTYTSQQKVTAVDIQGMNAMSLDEYREYVGSGLFFIDPNGVLRSEPAGYPLAVTKTQLDALIAHLKSIRVDLGH